MRDEASTDVGERAATSAARGRRRLSDVPRIVIIGASVVVAVLIGLVVRGTTSESSEAPTTTKAKQVYQDTTESISIADQLPLDPQYQQFLELASASGWLQELGGTADYTVFIPDSAAMSALPAEDLAALKADPTGAGRRFVERHVIEGKTSFVELVATGSGDLTTVDGSAVAVTVDGSTVTYDGATISKHDINARNGVIHVLGSVENVDTDTGSG